MDYQPQPRFAFLFDIMETSTPHEHDLPSNMVSSQSDLEGSLAGIGAEELETIFWQSRGHDGCYFSISIFQALAVMYPSSQTLRISLHNGTEFVTTLSARTIQEFNWELTNTRKPCQSQCPNGLPLAPKTVCTYSSSTLGRVRRCYTLLGSS